MGDPESLEECRLTRSSDIHPWEITVNGENWPGKIRLIGFVDVFFVIAYSANDCFMKGVIIYSKTVLLRCICPIPDSDDRVEDPKALNSLDGLRVPEPAKEVADNDESWDEYGYHHDSSDSGFDSDSDEDIGTHHLWSETHSVTLVTRDRSR